jgi:hypothetical protein
MQSKITTGTDKALAAFEAELINKTNGARPHLRGGWSKHGACDGHQILVYHYPQVWDKGMMERGVAYEDTWKVNHPVAMEYTAVLDGVTCNMRVMGHSQLFVLWDPRQPGKILRQTHADVIMFNVTAGEFEIWDIKTKAGMDASRVKTVAWALEQDDDTTASPFTAMVASTQARTTPTGKKILAIMLEDDTTDKKLAFTYWEPKIDVQPGDKIRLSRAYITTDTYTHEKTILLSKEIPAGTTKTGKPKKGAAGGEVTVIPEQVDPQYKAQVNLEAGIFHNREGIPYWPMCRLQIADPMDWNHVNFQSWRSEPELYEKSKRWIANVDFYSNRNIDALKIKRETWLELVEKGLNNWKTLPSRGTVRAECEHCEFHVQCAALLGVDATDADFSSNPDILATTYPTSEREARLVLARTAASDSTTIVEKKEAVPVLPQPGKLQPTTRGGSP